MKSMLVVGLGQFGRNLALKLVEVGNEVLVIDTDEERVSELAPYVTGAQIGDCQEESVLRSLGVGNFDVCFVCVSGDFQASLEITSTLKELNARYIVSKADRDRQSNILSKIGADVVIHPDMDMAERVAVKYSAKNVLEYSEFSDDYAITEVIVPRDWVGSTLQQLNIRHNYKVSVIAYKFGSEGNKNFTPVLSAEHCFVEGEQLLMAGDAEDILRMTDDEPRVYG